MKKFLITLAFLGLFSFWSPKAAVADNGCHTVIIICDDGSTHSVIACNWEQMEEWYQIFCVEHLH